MKFKDMPKLPLVLIAIMFAVGAYLYPDLPARIPTHWGASGQIDGWSQKSFLSVFGQPLLCLGLWVLFMLMPYLDPKRANLLRSRQVYSLILELVTGLFTVLFAASLAAAYRQSLPVDRVVTFGTGVMFVVLGNYMGRVKQNWTMGVRYSWTLADERVWTKTNRLGGRMFMLAGVMGLVGAFLPQPWPVVLLMAPALALVPATYVYSMLLYRRLHPEEMGQPPAEPPLEEG